MDRCAPSFSSFCRCLSELSERYRSEKIAHHNLHLHKTVIRKHSHELVEFFGLQTYSTCKVVVLQATHHAAFSDADSSSLCILTQGAALADPE